MNALVLGYCYRRHVRTRADGKHDACGAAAPIASSRGDLIAVTGGGHLRRVKWVNAVEVRGVALT